MKVNAGMKINVGMMEIKALIKMYKLNAHEKMFECKLHK